MKIIFFTYNIGMPTYYILGMFFALISGALNAFGAIFQKSVVNRVPAERRSDHFMGQLLRDPIWLLGLFMSMGMGTICNLFAQRNIGPALVPGLTASGMIILAIASARMIGERLTSWEIFGIVLMVLGISGLGYSRLEIPGDQVDLLDAAFLTRLVLFTLALGLCWLLSFLLARSALGERRGLILAVSGGFPFCLSNLWILPLLLTIGVVFGGTAQLVHVTMFIVASVMLVGTNLAGIRQVQESYKFAQASKVQPIQQVPTQIVPILIYFIVFQRTASGGALILISFGVVMIITSGFLLSRRKAEL